ncbi:MAG: ATP-dependent DNA ligase [Chloroflexi bacterium]|nr:ATP-dependent DNA ligase [Chloroflexota bacterium]
MRRWSELAERLAATTRTSEKTAILADYLRSLSPEELPLATIFLTGRPFAEADQRSTGLGWSAIASTVADLASVGRSALGEAYDRSSDLGIAVADVLAAAGHAPAADRSPTLPEVAAAFAAIETASGPARKAAILRELLERTDPLTAKHVVKVLGGDLRIGLREGLVEAAIARAFDRPLEAVKQAGMLVGDVGELAALARDDALASASLSLFHPLKFMLASPAEDADEIVARLGPEVWVEDKYDGIRCQLHKLGTDVRLYSRDLHDISTGYPEIVEASRGLHWDGILDGEILAWRDGTVLPFIALQTRLGRKAPTDAIRSAVPVIYVAFDALGLGPGGGAPVTPLLGRPLRERRARLDELDLPLADGDDGGRFARSYLTVAGDADALEAAFLEARARRNEGLMVKDPASIYAPGRRGLGWLKMKKALATIDCVVVGVEVGHGKRHGVLSDYTFAIRDTATGRLVNIGKAYSGLTDAEIAEMTRWFEAHTIASFGRYRQVEPTVVVEIAFDVIVRSSRHGSGFSLRFPRIARLRPDKTADEIDTVETVTALYEGLQHGPEHLVTAGARSSMDPST